MLALVAALAAPIALMVAMLAVPLVLFIEAERTDKLTFRWRLFWLFGLVKPRSRNRSAPLAPERGRTWPVPTCTMPVGSSTRNKVAEVNDLPSPM